MTGAGTAIDIEGLGAATKVRVTKKSQRVHGVPHIYVEEVD